MGQSKHYRKTQKQLKLVNSLLPAEAFFHRGAEGPRIAMTDDCEAEQQALSTVWSGVTLLLCVFHLLQALWRWEWDSVHKIDKDDRPLLFNLFKKLVYAQTSDEFEEKEKELFDDATVKKYPQFVAHIKNDILTRKPEWALSERINSKLPTHNTNTTNYVEVSFRLTKDNQFNRVRAFNLADLLDIILDDSAYYAMRCMDVSGNRTDQLKNQKSRYLPKNCQIDPTKIIDLGDNLYLVPSERLFEEHNVMYTVNMNLSICQCTVGMLHGPCKHKQLVAEHFKIASPDIIPHNNPKVRALYYYLATGEEKDASWFRSLKDVEVDDNISPMVDVFSFMRQPTESIVAENFQTRGDDAIEDENVTHSDVDMEVVEETKEHFENAIDNFKEAILQRIDEDSNSYIKCVRSFTHQLDRASSLNHAALQKALYTFVDDSTMPKKVGRKKRKRNISVQNTSKSRRIYKHRGSQKAQVGRPQKHVRQPKVVEGITYHSLPTGRKRKRKHPHSLASAVKANRAAEKKH